MITRWQRHSYRVGFPNARGVPLAGIVDRPRHPESGELLSQMPVAVFSHCFTCSKDLKAIARISRSLSTAGVAVLRFDMTGLGGSGGEFSDTNFSTNVADVAAAVRFAQAELGAASALIGHSFGGAASLAAAAALPVSDSLSDSLSDAQREAIGAVATIAAPSDTVHLARLLDTMNPDIERSGRGEVTIGGRSWTITREMLADFRRHALADHLPNIRCPVLAIHSPADATVHYDHALRIAGLVRDLRGDPACSLLTLSGADHLLIEDSRDADFVAQNIAAFLWRFAFPG